MFWEVSQESCVMWRELTLRNITEPKIKPNQCDLFSMGIFPGDKGNSGENPVASCWAAPTEPIAWWIVLSHWKCRKCSLHVLATKQRTVMTRRRLREQENMNLRAALFMLSVTCDQLQLLPQHIFIQNRLLRTACTKKEEKKIIRGMMIKLGERIARCCSGREMTLNQPVNRQSGHGSLRSLSGRCKTELHFGWMSSNYSPFLWGRNEQTAWGLFWT